MPTRRLALAALVLAAFSAPAPAQARPIAPVVDVTADSGARLVGETVAWKTAAPGTKATVEHLAGRTAANALTVLEWSSAVGHWQAQNVTALTGRTVAGPVAAWLAPNGPHTVEHLAGRAPDGSLLVFVRSSQNFIWKVVDVSAITGRRIADSVVAWQTPNGPYTVEHVAGRDALGNLLVFWWSPAHDWQVVDVSAKTRRQISTPVTAWQVQSGGGTTEYLAATDTFGWLDVFSWTPATDWQVRVHAQYFPAGVTAWVGGGYEHLAGARADGTLVVLWRSPAGLWNAVDVTDATAERIVGRPAVYQVQDGPETVDLLAARSPTGHLVLHWWKLSRDWQALDLTDITGFATTETPAAWLTSSGGRTVEHLTLQEPDGRLRIVYSFDQPRTLTDAVANETFGVKRVHGVTRKVLVVLWDPHYPNVPKPAASLVGHAAVTEVHNYFREQSGGKFATESAGVFGWYDADHPVEWYDSATSPHDKMGAALIAANGDVDYASYDTDGDDRLEPHEVALVFIHPGEHGGLIRGGNGSRRLKNMSGGDLVLDGVLINDGVEVSIGTPPNFPVVAHELGHLLLALPDMYVDFPTPTAPGAYSLMDNSYSPFHLDPFLKLKLGWAKPRLVFRTGTYAIPDVELRRRVYVLLDPDRGPSEYFLVENRWPGMSFDVGLPDRGLAVWHVMEDPAIFSLAPPPAGVSLTSWATIAGGWSRSAIRMVRPVLSPPNDAQALWDAATGYDLVSNDPNPAHPSLKWAGFLPSGIALRSFGSPGADMTVSVTVPWGPS